APDVNDDGFVAPSDPLMVINDINARTARLLSEPFDNNDLTLGYLDVDGDQHVSPGDALRVINHLNAHDPVLSVGLHLGADRGASSTDFVTSDARVSGEVTGSHAAITSVKLRMNRGHVFDVPVDAAGNFLATPQRWEPVGDGPAKAKVIVEDASGAVG